MVISLGADLHMAQLMPLPLIVSWFSKIQIGFIFLVPAHLGSPGQRAAKRVCVCACMCVCIDREQAWGDIMMVSWAATSPQPRRHLDWFSHFCLTALSEWNDLPLFLRSLHTFDTFSCHFKVCLSFSCLIDYPLSPSDSDPSHVLDYCLHYELSCFYY